MKKNLTNPKVFWDNGQKFAQGWRLFLKQSEKGEQAQRCFIRCRFLQGNNISTMVQLSEKLDGTMLLLTA